MKRALPLGSADGAVLDFVANYSSRTRLAGPAVFAKLRGRAPRVTRVLARIDDLAAHRQAWAGGRVPFAGVYAQDDTMSFEHEGAAFVVENLLPEDFSRRLARWRAGRGIAFGHEAISYDPATKALNDPADAADADALKLAHPARSLAEAFDTVLRGTIDAADLGLVRSDAFETLRTRVLSGAAGRRTSVQVARSLVRQAATLADALPAKKVASLMRSRLVSTSLAKTLGVSGESVAQTFEMKRAAGGGRSSNAAILLATLLGAEIANGGATNWRRRGRGMRGRRRTRCGRNPR